MKRTRSDQCLNYRLIHSILKGWRDKKKTSTQKAFSSFFFFGDSVRVRPLEKPLGIMKRGGFESKLSLYPVLLNTPTTADINLPRPGAAMQGQLCSCACATG